MKGFARRRTVRCAAIIALIAAVELGSAGFAIGVAASAGLSLASTVTVSIEGAVGTWAAEPAQSSAAAPTTTNTTTQAPAAPPNPAPDQSIVPTTPSTLETTPSAPAGTTPVDAPSGSSEPEPTTP
ncbi:hypothetical protein ACIA8G_26895 [Lentzea sp. NPDC051213]|uniref:hypothetical protein n=1 Tax=Lentzea sp. NPDC051213 TaxID=3364126 RepID=UPI0037B088FB